MMGTNDLDLVWVGLKAEGHPKRITREAVIVLGYALMAVGPVNVVR